MSAPAANPYDKVLYPSYTRQQSHPDRLATIGKLLGMSPAPVQRSRVLELGCGNGSNLAPIAFAMPESQFVGVDLATTPIQTATRMVREIGLTNIAFHQKSIADITKEFGEFDYIICHGVFSWVPDEVRAAILRVCRENLAPNGIAFVSYNAYPGNRIREMIREMMLYHIKNFEDPKMQIEQAQALAAFVAAAQDESDLYRKVLKDEMEMFLRFDGNYAFHDSLAEYNTPFYFSKFMEAAEAEKLQYLGEADFHSMLDAGMGAEVVEKLDELSVNRVAREQFLDFLRCRRFRQTLLCHENVQLDLSLKPALIEQFYLAGMIRCESPEPRPHEHVTENFENRHGARIKTDSPLTKTAFVVLREEWPQAISFPDLLARVRKILEKAGAKSSDPERDERELKTVLFRSYGVGLIDLHTFAAPCFRNVSERPTSSALARWQLQNQDFVTTLYHGAITVSDDLTRELLLLLDGSRDRDTLFRKLGKKIDDARKAAGGTGPDVVTDEKGSSLLRTALDQNLLKLARLGLLTA
jgi:2-polyprenyl-3-methyl-5-hydroxy-6-metoxy-1,4-benzoquinol methylase